MVDLWWIVLDFDCLCAVGEVEGAQGVLVELLGRRETGDWSMDAFPHTHRRGNHFKIITVIPLFWPKLRMRVIFDSRYGIRFYQIVNRAAV